MDHRQHLGRVDAFCGPIHGPPSVHARAKPTGDAARPFLERLDDAARNALLRVGDRLETVLGGQIVAAQEA
jgi:hypothetical protein